MGVGFELNRLLGHVGRVGRKLGVVLNVREDEGRDAGTWSSRREELIRGVSERLVLLLLVRISASGRRGRCGGKGRQVVDVHA